jgi:hypothetical protein
MTALPTGTVYPLQELIPREYWPDILDLAANQVRNKVGYTEVGTVLMAKGLTVALDLVLRGELELAIPGIDAIQLVVGAGLTGWTTVPVRVTLGASEGLRLALEGVTVALRFSADLLCPARRVPGRDSSEDRIEADPDVDHVDIMLGTIGLELDSEGNVALAVNTQIDLPLCLIGNTGVAMEAKDVHFFGRPDAPPPGKPAGWCGVHIPSARMYLPGELASTAGELALTDAYIGNGGFSGAIATTWAPTPLSTQLLGLQCELEQVRLTFVQNALTESLIKGKLTLPYFDKRVIVEIALDLGGGFSVKLAGVVDGNDVYNANTGLLTLTKDGILSMTVESLSLALEDGTFTTRLSGDVTPLFGGTAMKWLTFYVQDLSVDSRGNVRLEGGWLNLRQQKPLNFYGFQMEITKLGFGKTEDDGKWIGFSGGVKLVEGLPAGASVEGLRIVWYDDGSKPTSVTFNGVGVEFQVPGVLTFKGAVAYSGVLEMPTPQGIEKVQRFDGDIKLKLIALNMEIDAMLVIGSASGPRGNYNFFAIYVGVELPAGIPLWSTGLALYGMAGLFATQMEPNKGTLPNSLHPTSRVDEGWYESPDGSPGWYKRGTPGVTDLKTKWDPHPGSLAFGVGATIGTVPDNGTSFHGKFLLVLVFPGPIVLLEGRGNLLQQRTQPDKPGVTTVIEEPLFRALAVLDNRVGTFTIGLDAQYKYNEKGDLIDIHGGAEAFFSFSDANAWHIYLGREEPAEQSIRALIFKNLFEANAYFMLDPSFVRTGASVGIDKSLHFGPLNVALQAFIDGHAVISRKPAHFYGQLLLHGNAALRVFGFGVSLNVDAECTADVFDPFHVRFDFRVGIDLPWFLPDFEVDATLEWRPAPVPPPLPLPLHEIAIENPKVTTNWPLPRDGNQPLLLPNYDSDGDGFLNASTGASQPPDLTALPVVPLDSRPHITFGRAVNDDAKVGVNPQPANPEWERIGDTKDNKGPVRARYSLEEVELSKRVSNTWVPVCTDREDTQSARYTEALRLLGACAVPNGWQRRRCRADEAVAVVEERV